jgi:hypothetical protein
VNGDDYAIWRAQFGTSPGAGSAAHVALSPAGSSSEQSVAATAFASGNDFLIADLPRARETRTNTGASTLRSFDGGLTRTSDNEELLIALTAWKVDRAGVGESGKAPDKVDKQSTVQGGEEDLDRFKPLFEWASRRAGFNL